MPARLSKRSEAAHALLIQTVGFLVGVCGEYGADEVGTFGLLDGTYLPAYPDGDERGLVLL